MAQIRLWVKAGSTTDALAWDPWRKRWVVSCRAPPTGGEANRAVAALMADWLGLPHSSVDWVRAGSSRSKVLSADGITDAEADRRLRFRWRTG
ncbi:MAG TPA: DUF167 domain-containing protein [Thermoplasmata archaeon]|jgi:uncharacterized protein YggU (UPF0235/DUF167 family)